jgi:hypothetical protein
MRNKGDHLSEGEIETIRAAYAAGREPEDIAAETGISFRAVKRRCATMHRPAPKKSLPDRHYRSAFEPG